MGEKKQGRPIDKIIDCCTKKLGLNRSQVDDAIKKLLDDNVFQSYTYNSNLCYKVTKNFQNSNTDSYIAHNETVAALNNALFKISLKEKFDTSKMKFIDDFESMKKTFFLEISLLKAEMLQPNANVSDRIN